RPREPGLHQPRGLSHSLHRVTETVQIPIQQVHRPTVVPAHPRRYPVTAGHHLHSEVHQHRGGTTEEARPQPTVRQFRQIAELGKLAQHQLRGLDRVAPRHRTQGGRRSGQHTLLTHGHHCAGRCHHGHGRPHVPAQTGVSGLSARSSGQRAAAEIRVGGLTFREERWVVQVQDEDSNRTWTEPGIYRVTKGVYRIPLPMPNDGLRSINVYALTDGSDTVLVDSGWAIDEARQQLELALRGIGVGLGDISQFLITHVHRDHYTMAVRVRREFGNHIALGQHEEPSLKATADPDGSPLAAQGRLLLTYGATELV